MYEYSTTGEAVVQSSHPQFPYVRFPILCSKENWESENSLACRWRNIPLARGRTCKESAQETLSLASEQGNSKDLKEPQESDPKPDPSKYYIPYPGAPFKYWKTQEQMKAHFVYSGIFTLN